LRIKLKGRHFDTVEVMETESQAVLNTLTEHDFRPGSLLKLKEALGTVRTLERGLTTSRVMVTSRPNVIS
jgi:hypothetical protein